MRTVVWCTDGKRGVDLDSGTESAVHRQITRWFQTAAPDDILTVNSINSTVLLQKRYIIRVEQTS